MIIQQLSLFIENRAGQLRAPVKVLADAGINIRTLALADTEQFGIMRLIVDDPERARRLLEAAGCVVKVTEVIALEVPDHPGGLDGVLAAVEDAGLNIEYMYAFTFGRADRAVLVFRFDDAEAAISRLRERGVNVVDSLAQLDRSV